MSKEAWIVFRTVMALGVLTSAVACGYDAGKHVADKWWERQPLREPIIVHESDYDAVIRNWTFQGGCRVIAGGIDFSIENVDLDTDSKKGQPCWMTPKKKGAPAVTLENLENNGKVR